MNSEIEKYKDIIIPILKKHERSDLITYIFSLLNQGDLHKKMYYNEVIKYLKESFSGFPYLIQEVKKLYLLKH